MNHGHSREYDSDAAAGPAGKRKTRASTWDIARKIFAFVPETKWYTAFLVAIGIAASLAESLGITLLILFIYVVLGDNGGPGGAVGGLLQKGLDVLNTWSGGSRSTIASLLVGLIVVKFLLTLANGMLGATFSNRISEKIRNRLFYQLFDISYGDVGRYDRGELLSILATESFGVAQAHGSVVRLIVHLGALGVFGVFLIAVSWKIALIAVVGVGVHALGMKVFSRPMRRFGETLAVMNKTMVAVMLASLQGMRTIRAFAREPMQKDRFAHISRDWTGTLNRVEKVGHVVGTISEFVTLAILALIVGASGPLNVHFSSVLAAMALIYRMQPHLRELDRQKLKIHELNASLRRVQGILNRKDKVYLSAGSLPFSKLKQGIRFSNVWLTYPQTSRPSLVDASFFIPAGRRTAIVGPSGAGKTTIVNLLLRLVEPDQGRIKVDDADLVEILRTDWLARIAVAGQDVELIEGTVRENIAIVRPNVSDLEIAEAVRMAGIADFIDSLPRRYDEWIGDYGLNVSGGQRQRIGLARALVAEPDILILDEATSALDSAIENEIRHNIWRQYAGRTLVVVSHRLSTVGAMDHVICLSDAGEIVEEGDPKVLLRQPDSALMRMIRDSEVDAAAETA